VSAGITVARAGGGIATKRASQTPEGLTWTDYPHEVWWRFYEVETPADAAGWMALLEYLSHATDLCCLYGRATNTDAGWQRRLLHDHDGAAATLLEVPRDYLVLDLDSVAVPIGLDFLTDPATAIGCVLDTIDELAGCAFAAALSCGAGLKPGIRAKAVIPLSTLALPSDLRRWAKAVNQHLGMKLLDLAVLAAAQPLYFAKPLLHGVADPFPRRVVYRSGREPVVLAIPPEGTEAGASAGTPGSVGDGSGWRRHLVRLGPVEGFHDPLITTAGAVVHAYGGAPAEPIASAVHAVVRAAVLSTDAGARSQEEITRYASRRFWNDAIAYAAGQDAERFRRIVASVAGIRRA
jgi:hypothetical protein